MQPCLAYPIRDRMRLVTPNSWTMRARALSNTDSVLRGGSCKIDDSIEQHG